jgi:hypothetical protein
MNHKIYLTCKSLSLGIVALAFLVLPLKANAQISTNSVFEAFYVPRFISVHTESLVNQTEDAESVVRAERIDEYFSKRDMPLAGYGAKFVEVAKKCDIDWRLLPAIGVRESSGGKHLMNNNPFGWGSAKIKFDDFNDAIENVSDHLCGLRETTAKYYKDKTMMQKLWYYNGSVIPSYPKEVVEIMEMM